MMKSTIKNIEVMGIDPRCLSTKKLKAQHPLPFVSRRASLIESAANIVIGYIVAVAAQVMIFPMFGINVPLVDNLLIGALFTVVSLVRSYCLRRLFNKLSSIGNK